jgi:hypothetical protein
MPCNVKLRAKLSEIKHVKRNGRNVVIVKL